MKWRAGLVVLACLATTSCLSAAANKRFKEHVAEIETSYDESVAAIEARYRVNRRELLALRQKKVAVGDYYTPEAPVSEQPDLANFLATCDSLSAELVEHHNAGLDVSAHIQATKSCYAQYWDHGVNALARAYPAADLGWIEGNAEDTSSLLSVEQLFAYSHNRRIETHIAYRLGKLRRERDKALSDLDAIRDQALARAEEQREQDIAAKQREFAAILAAGMHGFQQSGQPSAAASSDGLTSPGQSPRCSSDFSCGAGHVCIKANYSSTGYCAQEVDEYGVPTFSLPDPDSVIPNIPSSGDCQFATDCPPGFTCETASGACLR